MFGHYLQETDSMATFQFIVHKDSSSSEINYSDIGLWEVRFKRYYFSNVYGSSEWNSPQRNPSETRESFIKNHEAFFSKVNNLLNEHNIKFDSISVSLAYLTPEDKVYKEKLVGTYIARDNKFLCNE